jgi:hypothetical protein
MSVRASTAVWHTSRATGMARLVFLALAEHANPDGLCWPSVTHVAEMCRTSERTVQRAMAALEASGELERTHRRGHTTSLYQFRLRACGKPESRGDTAVTPGVTNQAKRGDKSGARIGEPNTEPRAEKSRGDTDVTPTGATEFPPPDPDIAVHVAHIREQSGL